MNRCFEFVGSRHSASRGRFFHSNVLAPIRDEEFASQNQDPNAYVTTSGTSSSICKATRAVSREWDPDGRD